MLRFSFGLAWSLGSVLFGLMVIHKSSECSIARQYLTQSSLCVCGVCVLVLTQVQGYSGYVIFVWVYGIFLGGFNYSLKMYLFEKVRARNFAQAWGFVQCSQALPLWLGVPITGYINIGCDNKAGYYFSGVCILAGAASLSLVDLHKQNMRRRRKQKCLKKLVSQKSNGVTSQDIPEEPNYMEYERRNSFPDIDEEYFPQLTPIHKAYSYEDIEDFKKHELTCISEEGIADMELPDNLLDELEILENITSCNKVENYLMLSEYEQNLSKEKESPGNKKGRRWSLMRQQSTDMEEKDGEVKRLGSFEAKVMRRRNSRMKSFKHAWKNGGPNRLITTINEDSV